MGSYFDLVGDSIPNSLGEVHLEPIDIKDVWGEYNEDMSHTGERTLSVNEFGQIWLSCYPHVKIREYKAVTGEIKLRH